MIYEGKTELSEYENRLADALFDSVKKTNFSMQVKLLICLVINGMDKPRRDFEYKVMQEVDKDILYTVLNDFDDFDPITKIMVERCVTKGLIKRDANIKYLLWEYGDELLKQRNELEVLHGML